jgi:hypothetical protein
MPVVVDQFEATGEPAPAHAEPAPPPREPSPFETRQRLRAVALRSARVWARG